MWIALVSFPAPPVDPRDRAWSPSLLAARFGFSRRNGPRDGSPVSTQPRQPRCLLLLSWGTGPMRRLPILWRRFPPCSIAPAGPARVSMSPVTSRGGLLCCYIGRVPKIGAPRHSHPAHCPAAAIVHANHHHQQPPLPSLHPSTSFAHHPATLLAATECPRRQGTCPVRGADSHCETHTSEDGGDRNTSTSLANNNTRTVQLSLD